MKIPFLDIKSINYNYQPELKEAFNRVFESGWFIQGKELESFETEFAAYCGVEHCIGVANGLDALRLILIAYGIGPGDEVIVPSNTFIATWLAVTQSGAIPIPVEPDADTHNIAPQLLEAAITPRTAAIIPVHLYGQPADMDPINQIAAKHGLLVIEDAAQSQGARYKGKTTGGLAHAAATSFYPGKNLGALGDGGAILINDHNIADKIRQLRNYGSSVKYQHDLSGFNSRLDELQAAFLRIKLKHLEKENTRRKQIAQKYKDTLVNSSVELPIVPAWADPVWHLYVVKTKFRSSLQAYLKAMGVETLVHYPTPPHLQKCYSKITYPPLPTTEQLANEVLSLPISPVLTDEQVEYIVQKISNY